VQRKLAAQREFSDATPKPRNDAADLGIHRELYPNLLKSLSNDSVEKAWIHPFAITVDDDQPMILEDALKLTDREFSLPPRKPTAEDNQDVLHDRVNVVALWDVHEEKSTLLENACVLVQQFLGFILSKVFEETLVENDIEGGIRKGK